MKTSQLKTLIIIILAAVNIFLLAQIVPPALSRAGEKREITQSLCELCSQQGITVSTQALRADGLPAAMTAGRSTDRERAAAEAVLGDVRINELGGGICSYTSDNGEALFRAGGDFSVELSSGNRERRSEDAKKLLSDMGFDYDPDSVTVEEREEKVLVKAVQSIGKTPVFDCAATAIYGPDGLESVYGRWLTHTLEAPVSDEEAMDLPTVVVYFLDRCTVYGIVCSRIDSISPGYYSDRSAGSVSLRNCWQIATDTGMFFIDAADRRMVTSF